MFDVFERINTATVACILAVILASTLSCAQKEYGLIEMRVGETATILPDAPSSSPAAEKTPPANVRILLDSGGQLMDFSNEGRVLMYEQAGDIEPLYTFNLDQFSDMHETTSCNKELLNYLVEAFAGDSLFCNSSLQIDKVSHFVYERPGKHLKVATSYLLDFYNAEDDLVAVAVMFQ